MIAEHGIDCKGKEYQKIDLGKAKDYTGQKNGRLTALWRVKILNHDYGKQVFWLCQCECGNIIAVCSSKINDANKVTVKSCGCLQKEFARKIGGSNLRELTGKTVNGIEFLQLNQQYKINHHIRSKNAYWDCKCHCGKIFTANSGEILQNRIVSCGCLGTRKSKGEVIIEHILQEHDVNYVYDLAFFEDLILPSGFPARYDFVLLDNNDKPYRIIEFDGRQHYSAKSNFYNTKEEFQERQLKDRIKNEYALAHNIPLVRIPYEQLKNLSWNMLMGNDFLITK